MTSIKHKLIATAAVLLSTAAAALPSQIFFAEATPTTPESVDPNGAPATERARFMNAFSNPSSIASYGFENLIPGATPIPFSVTSNGISATFSGDSLGLRGEPAEGRFNTTQSGRNYLDIGVSAQGTSFSIAFASAVSAFGFYGTDIGDFDGELSLELTRADDETIVETLVIRGANAGKADNGTLLFYGFADANVAYSRVTFRSSLRTCSPTEGGCPLEDYFGFDDFVVAQAGAIAPPPAGVPEPGSVGLVGLALLAAATSLRKKTAVK